MNTIRIALTSVEVLASAMAADGWKHTPPADPFAAKIDRDVAEASTCDDCAHEGGIYAPFIQSDPRPGCAPMYRAFAVCRECGSHREF